MKTRTTDEFKSGGILRQSLSRLGLLAAFLLIGAGTRAAEKEASQPVQTKWFVEASAGLSIVPGGDISIGGTDYEADYKNGLMLRGALGREFNENWTVALEWFYRKNSAEEFVGPTGVIIGGDLASTNLFLHVTYTADDRLSLLGFKPYLGAGLGLMQEVDIDLAGFGPEEFSENWVMAWQWNVGIGRTVGRGGWLFMEGRAISGGGVDLQSSTGNRDLTFAYDTWSLLAGLRWSF